MQQRYANSRKAIEKNGKTKSQRHYITCNSISKPPISTPKSKNSNRLGEDMPNNINVLFVERHFLEQELVTCQLCICPGPLDSYLLQGINTSIHLPFLSDNTNRLQVSPLVHDLKGFVASRHFHRSKAPKVSELLVLIYYDLIR